MADLEKESKNRTNPSTPLVARRCRIPKLNRSSSVRVNGDVHREFCKSDIRPISLTLPSSKSKEFPWRYPNHGSVSSVAFNGLDDDCSSLKSFGSFMSYASIASQSRNTEASSRPGSSVRNKKYVLHCERHMGPTEEYLTPTQRKDKEIRQLKSLLLRKTRLCEDKEGEIQRLKSEIERLHDALSEAGNAKSCSMHSSHESDQLESINVKNSPSEMSFQSHGTETSNSPHTVPMQNDDSGISNDISISPRNSSEFDDVDTPTRKISSDKESSTDATFLDSSSSSSALADSTSSTEENAQSPPPPPSPTQKDSGIVAPLENRDVATQESASPRLSQELEVFLSTYQKELEQLKAQHKEHYQDLKVKFDERVQDMQAKLGEANSRYFELRPLFDRAQDKILTLESQLGEVQRDMETQEEWHNQMYLKMYRKGQEAARFEQVDEAAPDFAQRTSRRVSVPDLLRQLHQLEAELDETKQSYREAVRGMGDRQAEYTLRFLKDAVFYFLTKKDKEHLKAIQSILGFTDAERMAVAKAMKHRRL